MSIFCKCVFSSCMASGQYKPESKEYKPESKEFEAIETTIKNNNDSIK